MRAAALLAIATLSACGTSPRERAIAECVRHADGAPSRPAECRASIREAR